MNKTRLHRMRMVTDTATLAIFDPARLRHRIGDPADWWTWPPDVLADLNQGNVLPVDLGSDGVYEVTIHLDEERPVEGTDLVVSGNVGCDSGTLFVGPGEYITGAMLEPEESPISLMLPCPVGTYRIWIGRGEDQTIDIWLESIGGSSTNDFDDFPRLK